MTSDLLATACAAVDIGHKIVRDLPIGSLFPKGDRDFASNVDLAVEDAIRFFLAKETPEIPLLGEERGVSGGESTLFWALDPIDGTVNFAHGVPCHAISLALLDDGQPQIGVIDVPQLGSRYSASSGSGAFVDGVRISASQASELSNALIAIGDFAVGENSHDRNRVRLALLERLVPSVQRIRMLGSAAIDLSWVATGQLDGSITLSNNAWDVAAGVVIAREAGAIVLGGRGEPHTKESTATVAVAANLADEVMTVLREAGVE